MSRNFKLIRQKQLEEQRKKKEMRGRGPKKRAELVKNGKLSTEIDDEQQQQQLHNVDGLQQQQQQLHNVDGLQQQQQQLHNVDGLQQQQQQQFIDNMDIEIGSLNVHEGVPIPTHREQNVQVDLAHIHIDYQKEMMKEQIQQLSAKIRKLEDENAELKRKIRSQSAIKPRKALDDLSNKQLERKAIEIANFARERSPSIVHGSPATSMLMRRARRRLGVFSPIKADGKEQPPKTTTFLPEIDLLITLKSAISFYQRKELRRLYLANGMNFMASDYGVEQLKRELKSFGKYEWMGNDEERTLVCSNVAELLEHRVNCLYKNGLIKTRTGGKISIVLTDDKGGEKGTTKFGFCLAVTDLANSPNNFTLLALYLGDDDRKNLEVHLPPVLGQLSRMKQIKIGEKNFELEFFLCSDMKFSAAFFGHKGSAAKYPCVACLAKKGELGNEIVAARTLEQMKMDGQAQLNSMMAEPLLDIPPQNLLPATLHIIMGISQRVIDLLEAQVPERNVRQLKEWFAKNHCVRNPRSRNFTGNAIYKMLSDSRPDELTKMLPPSELRDLLVHIMWTLQAICKLSKARLLDYQELEELDSRTNEFFEKWRWLAQVDPKSGANTPKVHWLVAHLGAFARSKRWFAIVSEQCVEHIHAHFDRLSLRYNNMGNEEQNLLKLARHQIMLNGLFDRGFGDDGRKRKKIEDELQDMPPLLREEDLPEI